MDEIATQIKTYANNVRIYSQFSPKVYSFLTNSEKNKSINKNYPPPFGDFTKSTYICGENKER